MTNSTKSGRSVEEKRAVRFANEQKRAEQLEKSLKKMDEFEEEHFGDMEARLRRDWERLDLKERLLNRLELEFAYGTVNDRKRVLRRMQREGFINRDYDIDEYYDEHYNTDDTKEMEFEDEFSYLYDGDLNPEEEKPPEGEFTSLEDVYRKVQNKGR